jgi:CDP-6-deoxy-D-xylo-4-hexulose-3-dehydrase
MQEIAWPLATSTWGKEEKAALYEVIESDNYTMGDRVAQFEREFADFVGSPYAVMVNSGSSANLLMAQAIKWLRPQIAYPEIVVPAVGWATSYFPFADLGALRFVDIDSQTLNYDMSALRSVVSDQTRAIVAVNLLGNPNDVEAIRSLVPNAIVVEDNCESLGATFRGKQAGTFGAMGSYSFFFSHHCSTMEGGMVVTADEELYHGLLSLRSHGWTRHLPTENRICVKSPNLFEESFRFVLPGFNVRPGEMNAAAGSVQLVKLPGFISQRQKNARAFQRLMIDYPEIRTQKEVGRSSWFGFSLIVEPWAHFGRQELLTALTGQGIETRPIVAGNFLRQDVMKRIPICGSLKCPVADEVHDRGLMIGNNPVDMQEGLAALGRALESL